MLRMKDMQRYQQPQRLRVNPSGVSAIRAEVHSANLVASVYKTQKPSSTSATVQTVIREHCVSYHPDSTTVTMVV